MALRLRRPKGAVKKSKRTGRGLGSGKGVYAGKGLKGQKARAGYRQVPGFEGGQTPLYRRIPKRGFKPPKKEIYGIVNVKDLNKFEDGTTITHELLYKSGLVNDKYLKIKILGNGELERKLEVKVDAASKSAIEKIKSKGGNFTPTSIKSK